MVCPKRRKIWWYVGTIGVTKTASKDTISVVVSELRVSF